jgi:D-alanyl-D-alanine carboxypeptidase
MARKAVVVGLLGLALALPARGAAADPVFHASISPIPSRLKERMIGVSWQRGCPVRIGDLRLLQLDVWGFDAAVHGGRLIVNADQALRVKRIFRTLFANRYPIRRMRVIDAYGGSDERSMADDNTSAFNCRFVAGSERWSEHAYGRAIDVNPIENPYADDDGYVSPPQGAPFADRSRRAKGLIHRGGPVVVAFAAVGWGWGGSWEWPKDFQHFSATGT